MEAEIKFEPSGRNGVVAVGTYLLDAAKRLGVTIEDEFGEEGLNDFCFVKVTKGNDLLSKPTKAEIEHLSQKRRNKGERLPSQAKIERSGEIIVMVTAKKQPDKTKFEEYRKEFDELPLDEKVKNLLELESAALGDTFAYILNLPSKIGEKLRDGIAEFGFKMEEDAKNAKRPQEHKEEKKADTPPVNTEDPIPADYSQDNQDNPEQKKTPPQKKSAKNNTKPNDETNY